MKELITNKYSPKVDTLIRKSIGVLLLLIAINAFGGGYYAMSGADGVPLEWLHGSPFRNYFLPGLFLLIVIGGSSLFAALLVFRQHVAANTVTFICGAMILSWLIIQVSIIGYVSWMQPVTALITITILLLNYKIKKNEH